MRKILAINWGMSGDKESISRWLQEISCPPGWQLVALLPAVYLDMANELLNKKPRPLALGAQTVSAQPADGPFTGEFSARMLAEVGAKYVLAHPNNTYLINSKDLYKKTQAALEAGIIPLAPVPEEHAKFSDKFMREIQFLSENSVDENPATEFQISGIIINKSRFDITPVNFW